MINMALGARVAPFYMLFLVVMAFAGLGVTALFRPDRDRSAVVFTGATRNALVMLPMFLALPNRSSIAAAAVVAQTVVEVWGMVAYLRLKPRLVSVGHRIAVHAGEAA